MHLRRETSLLAGLLLGVTPFLLGQEPNSQNIPTEDAVAVRQLIAWSRLQRPQPVPQPLPQPDAHPDPQPAQPRSPHTRQETPTQVFVGMIVRDAGRYTLNVSGNVTFQLDDQNRAEQYQDKDVKIVGTIDTGGKTIHVRSIEGLG